MEDSSTMHHEDKEPLLPVINIDTSKTPQPVDDNREVSNSTPEAHVEPRSLEDPSTGLMAGSASQLSVSTKEEEERDIPRNELPTRQQILNEIAGGYRDSMSPVLKI